MTRLFIYSLLADLAFADLGPLLPDLPDTLMLTEELMLELKLADPSSLLLPDLGPLLPPLPDPFPDFADPFPDLGPLLPPLPDPLEDLPDTLMLLLALML